MKIKTVLIFILILLIACVPCLVSLAEDGDESSAQPASSSANIEPDSTSSEEHSSDSSESDDSDKSESSDSTEDTDDSSTSSEESKSSSSSKSGSSGSRFSGDPVQGKTPKFADLDLGDGDPDDGKDFKLEPEENDGLSEVTIRNTEAKGMKGNDNFYVDFKTCELWIPIEIPAVHVEDDHINSKLVAAYGPVNDSIMDKVSSAIQSSHILQTFTLALTAYDAKGRSEPLDTFDGQIKFICDVNAASVNQYNRDGKLALVVYNSETRSLDNVEYEIDTNEGKITVYTSSSGDYFLINSDSLDLSSSIKLNSNAPFLKVVLITGAVLSIGASVVLIAMIIIKGRKQKAKSAKY